MSYDRPTVKDVRRIFDQYEELVKEYGLIRPGYNLSLDIGSKTYGHAYRVYEVADRSLWGKKEGSTHPGCLAHRPGWATNDCICNKYGSGQYEPTIGQSYLGMTTAEACESLITRRRMIYDMSRAWGIEKTNPILGCGHFPTPTPSGSICTGEAYNREGVSMCYSCADEVGTSVVGWAKAHGVHFRWSAALDNHEPTRNYAHGDMWTYPLRSDDGLGIVLDGSSQMKDRTKMTIVMDDGETVRPYYVASWNANSADDYVILHPFPTNYNEDGTPKVRPDGRMVDMSGWAIGPSKLYHLKVSKMEDGK